MATRYEGVGEGRPAKKPKRPSKRALALAQERQYGARAVTAPGQVSQRSQRVTPPSATRQRALSLAQERQYASQGNAVQRVAEQLRRQRMLEARERYYGSMGTRLPARPGQPTRSALRDARVLLPQGSAKQRQALAAGITAKGVTAALEQLRTRRQIRAAANLAPALLVFDQLMRPVHAEAGGARALVRGEGAGKALSEAAKGARNQASYTFSDVLKESAARSGLVRSTIGAKKLRPFTGFALDVALDPLTYLTFGTGTVARQTLGKAARDAAAQAAKATQRELTAKVARHEAARRSLAAGDITDAQFKRRLRAGEIMSPAAARRAAKAKGREIERRITARGVAAGQAEGPKGITVRVTGARAAQRALARRAARGSKPGAVQRAQQRADARRRAATTTGTPDRPIRRTPHGPPVGPLARTEAKAPLIRLTRDPFAIRSAGRLAERGLAKTKPGRNLVTGLRQHGEQTRAAVRGSAALLHGNVRPGYVSAEQERLAKRLRREMRARGERVARHATARGNRLTGRLSEAEAQQVIHALEHGKVASLKGQAERLSAPLPKKVGGQGGFHPLIAARSYKTRRDPDRLHRIARGIEQDLKYFNRVGRHSGALAGQVGMGSRSRAEAALAAPAGARGRSTVALEAKRVEARKALNQARAKQRKADTDPKRRASANEVQRAKQRVDNLTGLIKSERTLTKRGTVARKRLAQQRKQRFATEARGYYPRAQADELTAKRQLRQLLAKPPESSVPRFGQGSNQPQLDAAGRREFRQPRDVLARGSEQQKAAVRELINDPRRELAHHGTKVGRVAAGLDLNRELFAHGKALPRNITEREFYALKDNGQGLYRLHRGQLTRVEDYQTAKRASQSITDRARERIRITQENKQRDPDKPELKQPPEESAQYAIIDDALLARVRQSSARSNPLGETFDWLQGTWKSLALATPGYLVRNVLGDAFNAAVHENPYHLARNAIKAQKALHQLGRVERSARSFERRPASQTTRYEQGRKKALALIDRYEHAQRALDRVLPELRTIKLTDAQAAALGTTRTEIPAIQAALLAEKNGVIRQGRFLELIEEGARRPRAGHWWQDTVKRAEDSVRMTTFLGSLQRGLDPAEAAENATKIHFDYGDLTDTERKVLRRVMPFYTFTSRNIPLQARGIATKPGRYAAVAKAREEGRKATGLPEDFGKGLNPYEARQLGIPITWGKDATGKPRKFTISVGSPFVDLNDIAAVGSAAARGRPADVAATALQRVAEMTSPLLKTGPELKSNYSWFYRDDIQRDREPLTRAPQWAIELAKHNPTFRERTGMTPDYVAPEGAPKGSRGEWGWSRKADYFFRQGMPGPIQPLIDLLDQGVEGENARTMSKAQRLLAASGLRAVEYTDNRARINEIYDRLDTLTAAKQRLMRRAHPTDRTASGRPFRINADHPTPEFLRLAEQESRLGEELDRRTAADRPHGFVAGEPVEQRVAKALGVRTGPRVRTGVHLRTGPHVRLR